MNLIVAPHPTPLALVQCSFLFAIYPQCYSMFGTCVGVLERDEDTKGSGGMTQCARPRGTPEPGRWGYASA